MTQAAKRLGMSEPALSKQLQEIERRIQTRLFERGNGGVVTTGSGRSFVAHAAESVQAFRRAVHEAQESKHNAPHRLRIGVSTCHPPNLIGILCTVELRLYKSLSVDIVTAYSFELIGRLQRHELDLAIITSPPPNALITSACFATNPFMIVLRQRHPLAGKASVSLHELGPYPWVFFNRNIHHHMHDLILQRTRAECEAAGISHSVSQEEHAVALLTDNRPLAWLTPAGAERAAQNGLKSIPLATCAGDGLCSTACPVNIDTGHLTKRLRAASHSALTNRMAGLIARRMKAAEVGARFALRAGHAVQAVFGLRFTVGVTRMAEWASRRLMDEPFWKWCEEMPRPRRDVLRRNSSARAVAVYFPSCVSRVMGALSGESEDMSVMQAFLLIADRAGMEIDVPVDVEGNCCGVPFSSKGIQAAHRAAAERTIEKMFEWSHHGKLPAIRRGVISIELRREPFGRPHGNPEPAIAERHRLTGFQVWSSQNYVGSTVAAGNIHLRPCLAEVVPCAADCARPNPANASKKTARQKKWAGSLFDKDRLLQRWLPRIVPLTSGKARPPSHLLLKNPSPLLNSLEHAG